MVKCVVWHVFGLVGKTFGESLEICSLIITFFHAGTSGIWTLNFAHLRIYTTDRSLSINKMSSSVSIIFWCYHLSFFTRFCPLSSFWSKLSNVTNTATEDKSINKMRLISVTNAQLSKFYHLVLFLTVVWTEPFFPVRTSQPGGKLHWTRAEETQRYPVSPYGLITSLSLGGVLFRRRTGLCDICRQRLTCEGMCNFKRLI